MDQRDFVLVIQSNYPSMRDVDRRIANYILQDPEKVIHMNVSAFAKELGVAPSTIVNFCKLNNYKGYPDMKISIARNLDTSISRFMDDVKSDDSASTILEKVYKNSMQALMDAYRQIDTVMVENAVEILQAAKKILFFGLGSSSPIAMDAYYRFMRVGFPAYLSVDPLFMRSEAQTLNEQSVAFAISHFGRTRDVVRTAEIARKTGAKVIGLTSFTNTPLSEFCDIVFVTNTHETQVMKEAMTARLAQIAFLDSLLICLAKAHYPSASEYFNSTIQMIEEARL